MLALCLALVLAWPAGAHHFKGLPHYNYFANYPQIPQEEFLGQAGDYEFSLVVYDFQGLRRQDLEMPDDARLFLVAFDLRGNRVYNGPVLLEILDGQEPVRVERREQAEEENLYALHHALPPEGDYALRVKLLEGGIQAVIPFKLSSQKTHWGHLVAAVLVGLVAVAAVGARRARIAQDRRKGRN
jgi:hypothetical protein